MANLSDMKYYVISTLLVQGLFYAIGFIPFKTLFFSIIHKLGLNTYHIRDIDVVRRIQKRLLSQCNEFSDERGYGIVVGKWYFVDIKNDAVMIISSKDIYTKFTEEFEEAKANVDKYPVTIFDRSGPYTYNWYYKRQIYIHSIASWKSQDVIIDKILEEYKTKKHAVAMLHGPPGCGKSMTALLLTIKVKGNFCNMLKPWMPNTTIASLYTASNPSEDSPLIIAMDEFDGPLLKIHNGEIPTNEKLPTLVTDKTGWNLFFDEIQRGMYPFVIVILTTNKTPQFFNELDSSYIRKGRVDLIEDMSVAVATKI